MSPGPLDWRIILDVQATQSSAHADRGVARYVKDHARSLLRRGVGEALLLNPHLPFPRELDQDLLVSPLLRWGTQGEVRAIAEADDSPIAYHLMSPFELSLRGEGDLPPHALRGDVPVIATLYDLIPLVMADRYLTDEILARRYRARAEAFHQLDLVLAISEHTRRDAIERLGLDPKRIVTIGGAVSDYFRPTTPGEMPRRLLRQHLPQLDDRPYVLTVAGGDPRKNTERLIDAWASVPADVRGDSALVITCHVDPVTRARWEEHTAKAGVTRDVIVTGFQPESVLRALYQACELSVVPSLYEGYGLPAAEAIACGTPVITSSTTSLPEIVDWREATFDPDDTEAIAAAIVRGLTDDAFRRELLERGAARRPMLSWDAVAQRTIDAVVSVLGPAPSSPTELPVRIALVGPMPPTMSGIADYNGRLLTELAARADVDVFTSVGPTAEARALDIRWFPPRALQETCSPWGYDAIVYTVGNSDDHHDLYDLAQEFPGVLWMHDVRLPGLYLTYANDRLGEERGDAFLRDRLLRQYRRRLPLNVDWTSNAHWTQWQQHGLGLSRELVDVARAVVVSSNAAARLLQLDQQPDGRSPAHVEVLPLAAPALDVVRAARVAPDAPAIVCFGMVAPVKAPELLIAALAVLRSASVAATLTLVGPVGDGYREHLESLAEDAGVSDTVTITGHVDASTYRDWLLRGTVALQLRHETNGESSAAILDCLAAGLPVITNMPAAAELPEDTVELVPWDVDPTGLAHAITVLLSDRERLAGLGEAGRSYAASWGAEQVIDRLLALVRSLTPEPPRHA